MTMNSVEARQRIQRRIVAVLAAATILGGLGIGAAFSAGSLLIVEVTGSSVLSGFASTMVAVGAAIAGIPLGYLASRRGRRLALTTGNVIAAFGAIVIIWSSVVTIDWLLIVGFGVLGVASAVQLQSRFAAADLALPVHRARDLSLVVWSVTVGAVIGPNLIGLGQVVGEWLAIPALSGVFVFTAIAQALSAALVMVALRPDPLLTSRQPVGGDAPNIIAAASPKQAISRDVGAEASPAQDQAGVGGNARQFTIIAVVALAHAVMVALMAMTPVHIVEHGGSFTLVGVTISLHIAGMYALSPVAGFMTSRYGGVPVLFVGFIILALAAAGTAFGGDSMLTIQLALLLLGLGWCAVTVAGAVLLTEATPLNTRPRRQGQSDTIMNAAGAALGAASGAIFALGGFAALSLVAGVAIAVGFVGTTRLVTGATRNRQSVIRESESRYTNGR